MRISGGDGSQEQGGFQHLSHLFFLFCILSLLSSDVDVLLKPEVERRGLSVAEV